jgi:hypothetical protein
MKMRVSKESIGALKKKREKIKMMTSNVAIEVLKMKKC